MPIRVEFKPLTEADFRRILVEPKYNLIMQSTKLLETEGVTLKFEKSAIEKIASLCWQLNQSKENIGARMIRTVSSKVVEEISFTADELKGSEVIIDDQYVLKQVQPLLQKVDLSKYVL